MLLQFDKQAIQQHLAATNDEDDDRGAGRSSRRGANADSSDYPGGTETSTALSDLERYFTSDNYGMDDDDDDDDGDGDGDGNDGDNRLDESGGDVGGKRSSRNTQPPTRGAVSRQGMFASQTQRGDRGSTTSPTDTSMVDLPPSLLKHFAAFDTTSSTSSSQDLRSSRCVCVRVCVCVCVCEFEERL